MYCVCMYTCSESDVVDSLLILHGPRLSESPAAANGHHHYYIYTQEEEEEEEEEDEQQQLLLLPGREIVAERYELRLFSRSLDGDDERARSVCGSSSSSSSSSW